MSSQKDIWKMTDDLAGLCEAARQSGLGLEELVEGVAKAGAVYRELCDGLAEARFTVKRTRQTLAGQTLLEEFDWHIFYEEETS